MILNSNSTVPSLSAPRGQKRINLREALALAPDPTIPLAMTFGELSAAYIAVHLNGAEMQLRKWIDLLGERSAWEIAPNELARAGVAMIDNGYSPSTVNRNLSQIGSIYRWAKRRMLTPAGFISPTISQYRYEEPIRHVNLSQDEVKKLIDGAAAVKDRRFQVMIRLLLETGARRGEIALRRWGEVDLENCTIELLETKTGKPRMLFFSAQTATLMRRIWPNRAPEMMLFESRRAPGSPVNYKKHWETLRRAIGRDDLRLHDLRHHRAKLLIESGSSVAVAAQALGHSSLILHRRYGHLESTTIENAVKASWREK